MKKFTLITLLIIGIISFMVFLFELLLSFNEAKGVSALVGLVSFALVLTYSDDIWKRPLNILL